MGDLRVLNLSAPWLFRAAIQFKLDGGFFFLPIDKFYRFKGSASAKVSDKIGYRGHVEGPALQFDLTAILVQSRQPQCGTIGNTVDNTVHQVDRTGLVILQALDDGDALLQQLLLFFKL